MKINKKLFITIFIIMLIIIIGTVQYNKLNVVNKFINYNQSENIYTRFDLTINLENKMISNITTNNDKSKDRITLLKQLKNLEQTEFMEFNKKTNADILIIIQENKILDKNSFNHYFANLNIYLEDNIICLDVHGELHNENSTIKKTYYKMDKNTKKLSEKIIKDAINE